MSRVLVTAAVASALVLGGSLAHAQSKSPKGGKMSMVEAMCPGTPPTVAKCNPATFVSGTASLKGAKSPAPFNMGTDLVAGSIQIKGVSPAPPGDLDCELDGITSFGSDPDVGPAHCALAGTTVGLVPGGVGRIPCVPSGSVPGGADCKGVMKAAAALPDNCTNVKITVEQPEVTCWLQDGIGDDTQKIATIGTAILPGPDCTGQTPGDCK